MHKIQVRKKLFPCIARYLGGMVLFGLLGMPALAQDWVYSTRPGDNLWNLAEEYLVEGTRYTTRLQRHNGIDAPTRIPAGTRIRFPIRWLKQQPASARLVRQAGTVTLHTNGGAAPQPAPRGAALNIGDRLQTSAQSAATVQFADGSRMLVQAESSLTFDSMSAYHTTGMVDTTMRLHRGRVENDVKKAIGPGSRFRIITPAAIAAVRGTHFRIGFRDGDATMFSEVTGGEVGVSAQDVTRELPAGFGLLAKTGSAPPPPRVLLVAPDLASLPARAERVLLEFEWPAIAGAANYRAQLYAAADPEILLLDKVVDSARVEWNAPADGEYVLHVRGAEADGLEGLSAKHAFVLHARPAPPSPLKPVPNAKIHGPDQSVLWSKPESAASYHLQIARDEGFADRVVDAQGLTDTKLALQPALVPGNYWWRLAMVNQAGEKGPFGDPRALRVLAVPAALAAGSSSVGEDGVLISLGKAADAAGYEFQIARDAQFSELVSEEVLKDTQYKFAQSDSGTFYYRARGVSNEDVRGPWSPVNQFEIEPPPWNPLMILTFLPLLLL